MILNILNNILSLLCGVFTIVYYFINNSSSAALNILKGIGLGLAALVASYLVIFIIIWLFFISVSFFIRPNKDYDKPSKVFNAIFILWYSYITNFFRVKIRVTGLEKVPFGTRFLAIANHRSNLDNMIQALVLKKEQIAYISKPENFKIPIGGRFMKRGLYLSMPRGNTREEFKTVMKAIEYLKDDKVSIGIFPEGTRSKDGKLREFKPGAFKIAEKAQCPIVVVSTKGTFDIHKNWPWKKTHVYMDILDVIEPTVWSEKNTVEVSQYAHNLILNNLNK